MTTAIESLADSAAPSWLIEADPRARIIAAALMATLVISLQQPLYLFGGLLCALVVARLSPLSMAKLWRRLLALEGFMLLVLLLLPFSIPGQPLWQWQGYSASVEGLERAIVIMLRANIVVILLLSWVGTLEPETLGHALARLKLPAKLVQLLLMTVRYVSVLEGEYRRLRQAMRARAFVAGSNRHTWRSYGWLIGMLLVRSMERAQRVQTAMKCRGYQGRFHLLDSRRWHNSDSWLVLAGCAPFLILVWLEYGR